MQGFTVPDSDRLDVSVPRSGPRVRQVVPPAPAKPPAPRDPLAVRKDELDIKLKEKELAKTDSGDPPLSEAAKAAARRAAISKINLLRSVRRRLIEDKGGVLQGDLIPETGLLGVLASKTGVTNASDIAADIETLKRGGALSSITTLMEQYGKNPFSPMANYESELLAGIPGNLTLNQRPENLLKNLDQYEQFYTDVFKTFGGKFGNPKKQQAAPAGNQPAQSRVVDFNDLPE